MTHARRIQTHAHHLLPIELGTRAELAVQNFRFQFFCGPPILARCGGFRYPFPAARKWSPMICPDCRSVDCFRSHRDGALDFLNGVTGLRPWRCHTCDRRFYAWRVATRFQGYAHCPRCGNFDLENISRERVEAGPLIMVKRWLGFPAYRCDPCRHRFFSIRRFRRILPSLLETPSSGKVVAG